MSDSLADFEAKTAAMFSGARERLIEVSYAWVMRIVDDVVTNTPGPGNQLPYDTEYIATGRLRAGWSLSDSHPPSTADRWEGGPYDDDGSDTIAQIGAELTLAAGAREFFVWNDVAYGYIVRHGLGRHDHIGPRFWIEDAIHRGRSQGIAET